MSRCNLFRVSAGTAALLAFCWCGLLSGCSDSRPVKAPPVSDPDPPMAAAPAPSPSMSSDAADEGTPAAAPTLPGSGGLDAFRADLESADQQIDATLASLAELTDPKQEDLRAAYDRYCDQLARMQESADAMKREADAMRESRNAYFASWEERTSDVGNP